VSFDAAYLDTHVRSSEGRLAEQVARRLVAFIVTETLPSGAHLPVESALRAQLGVGKNTLRQALRLLEDWGVIDIRQGRGGGPVVRSPRPDDLRGALSIQLLFASAPLKDVMEARCCFEPQGAALAAMRMGVQDVDELHASVERMRAATHDQYRFLDENRYFHARIAAVSGNVVIKALLDALKSVLDGSSRGISYGPSRILAVADAHARIASAIASGEPTRAHAEMESHLRQAGDFWKALEPGFGAQGPWA
jgi:GntR family transcriptional repressor for pyruvate dehydrogenase complex